MKRLVPILVLSLAAWSCGGKTADPRPQWVVVISTDAPVPTLGDRLLIEVLDAEGKGACSGCRREIGVLSPDLFPLSFGLLPIAAATQLRVRLYKADHTGPDGLPEGDQLLDTVAALPAAPTDVTTLYLPLSMSCFGIASDPSFHRSCDTASGQLGPAATLSTASRTLVPGSASIVKDVPCRGATPSEMVCIPGGLFVLGDPHYVPLGGAPDVGSGGSGAASTPSDDITSSIPEHLVRLDPYAIDRDELTVGQLKAIAGLTESPVSQSSKLGDLASQCTFRATPENDAYPVNCVSKSLAAAACSALGKRLPTEAEWEFAAGNRTDEATYPWGFDASLVCANAQVAAGTVILSEPGICFALGATISGATPGGNPADVTTLGVRNMAGNVSEWVADTFAPYTDPCWNPGPKLLVDPMCTESATASIYTDVARGGNFESLPFAARTFERSATAGAKPSVEIGIRCAKSM